MLEAEIICVDLEKIMAVLLSIIVQLDVTTGKIAKKEREVALRALAKLIQTKSRQQLKSRLKAAATRAELVGKLKTEHSHVQFTGKDEQKII